MNCAKCGSKTKVKSTEAYDEENILSPRPIMRRALMLVKWYTYDFTSRYRVCKNPKCKTEVETIELLTNDLKDMLYEVSEFGLGITDIEPEPESESEPPK